MVKLLLITTDDCGFCTRAHEVLDTLGVDVREVSAASAEARALAERGMPLVVLPVLTDGRRIVAAGRFSERRLRKELAAGRAG